jgi:hypothetical protein
MENQESNTLRLKNVLEYCKIFFKRNEYPHGLIVGPKGVLLKDIDNLFCTLLDSSLYRPSYGAEVIRVVGEHGSIIRMLSYDVFKINKTRGQISHEELTKEELAYLRWFGGAEFAFIALPCEMEYEAPDIPLFIKSRLRSYGNAHSKNVTYVLY